MNEPLSPCSPDRASKTALQTPAQLASQLACRARLLATRSLELMRCEHAPGAQRLRQLLHEAFHLGPNHASLDQLADAYAQTVTYGMLATRWLSCDRLDLLFSRDNLAQLLPSTSPFLHDLIHRLLDSELDASLTCLFDDLIDLLARTSIAELFRGRPDPAIHFYEEFLDAYAPQLRKDKGVYYTPDEVVSYVVRTAHATLQSDFGLPLGLADTTTWSDFANARQLQVPSEVDPNAPFVQVLDPAAGTGTFLLRAIQLIHEVMQHQYCLEGLDSAAARQAWLQYVRRDLLPRLHGFELMPAAYVVSHLRLGLALQQTGFVFEAQDRLRVFLANTLSLGARDQATAERCTEEAAEQISEHTAFSVIVGNPPYEREPAAHGSKGGRVVEPSSAGRPLIEDFDARTRAAGAGGSIQTTRNLYAYFWRWSIWQALDRRPFAPAIVSLVTASSYLRGPGFAGMRAHMREACDQICVLDLEGDQLGTRITSNVFAIKIPVCIGTLVRLPTLTTRVAAVRHFRVTGERDAKLRFCAAVSKLDDVPWSDVRAAATGPLLSEASASYDAWPGIAELFPLRFTGYHFYRTWPIAPTRQVLQARWSSLVRADGAQRALLFKETRDRKIDRPYSSLDRSEERLTALAELAEDAPCPEPSRTCFRALDRQWCLADARLGDFLRPALWRGWSHAQCYITSLLSGVLGAGPGAMAAAYVPDCHHFRGSYGGKDVIPLWRDAEARCANLNKALLTTLTAAFGAAPLARDVFAYAYAVLANPGYVRRFEAALQVPGPRLPITTDQALFARGAALGGELLCWHTYGERFIEGLATFKLSGAARVTKSISCEPTRYPERHAYDATRCVLKVGDGEIGPVSPEVWRFAISGLQVAKSWLDYRMKKGAGKKSSPLDAIRPAHWTDTMTRELIDLLWVIEHSLARYPELDSWLDQVLRGPLLASSELA